MMRSKYRPPPANANDHARWRACPKHELHHAGYDWAGLEIVRCKHCNWRPSLIERGRYETTGVRP